MFYFPLASLGEIHVRPARERGVAVPRRLAVPYEYEFAGFRGSQQVARPGDREALLAVAFEQFITVVLGKRILLVQERRRAAEDVVDLERLRGCREQERSDEMHCFLLLRRVGSFASQGCRAALRVGRRAVFDRCVLGCGVGGWRSRARALLLNDLALSSPERRVRACSASTGRVLPKVC